MTRKKEKKFEGVSYGAEFITFAILEAVGIIILFYGLFIQPYCSPTCMDISKTTRLMSFIAYLFPISVVAALLTLPLTFVTDEILKCLSTIMQYIVNYNKRK